MAEGKKLILTLLIILIYVCQNCHSTRSPSVLKGGLVYSEESHQGPVYLNQNYFTFARKTNTTTLALAAKLCRDLTYLYESKCKDISASTQRFNAKVTETINENKNKKDDPYELVVAPSADFIANAPAVCKAMDARLPEIRDKMSREKVRLAAIENGIKKIRAGITYDKPTLTFRFNSDQVNALQLPQPWTSIYYGATWTDAEHGEETDKLWHIPYYAPDWPVIYSNPDSEFRLKLADTNEIWSHTKVLCEKKRQTVFDKLQADEASSPLIQLADHSCRRDMKGLMQTTEILIGQISQITNLNISIPQTTYNPEAFLPEIIEMDDLNRKRKKQKRSVEEPNYDLDEVIISNILYASTSANISYWVNPYQESLLKELRHIFEIEKSGMEFTDWLKQQLNNRSYLIQGIHQKLEYTEIALYNDNVLAMLNDTMPTDDMEDLTNLFHFIVDSRIYNLFVSYIKTQYHRHDPVESSEENSINYDLETDEEFLQRKGQNSSEVTTSRNKRAIPVWVGPVAGVAGGANIISSFVTGEAPLSWFGDVFSALFGLQTKAQNQAQTKLVLETAEAVDKLSINQNQLTVAINAANARIDTYSKYVMSAHKAISVISMEQDLKAMVRHLQLLIDTTLQKVANILVASMSGVISPYAINQNELEKVANDVSQDKKIKISTAFTDTRMQVAIVQNELVLIFQSPIIDESQLYHFYRVKPMPVFIQNRTFMPEIDAEYTAISHTGSDYISLSPDEFSRCTATPRQCYVTSPAIPLTSGADCTMVTYRDLQMKCPLTETNIPPQPTLHIKDNKVIYSVPSEITLLARCENYLTHVPDQAHFKVQGMGEISFRPACTVTLPDGSHFKTPTGFPTENIRDLDLYEILNIHPVPSNVSLRLFPVPIEEAPKMTLSFDDMSLPSLEQLRLQAYHPAHAVPFLIRLLSVLAVILIIALFIVCYCKCITNYSCSKRQKPDEPDYNNNDMNDINHRLQQIGEEISHRTAPNWSRWKSGSSMAINSLSNSMMDLRNRVFKTGSTPNLNNQDKAEKGHLMTSSYMSNRAVDEDQLSVHRDRVKYIYKPVTPILKRRADEDDKEYNPELLRPQPAVRFNSQEMGPHNATRASTLDVSQNDRQAKRLKETLDNSDSKL